MPTTAGGPEKLLKAPINLKKQLNCRAATFYNEEHRCRLKRATLPFSRKTCETKLVKTLRPAKTKSWRTVDKSRKPKVRPILGRFIGLETQYELRVSRAAPLNDERTSSLAFVQDVSSTTHRGKRSASSAGTEAWFLDIMHQVELTTPTAESLKDARQFFLANGSSVSFDCTVSGESTRGSIAAATPECRSPIDLVTAQAALDQLLVEAVEKTSEHESVGLMKRSADEASSYAGQQEKYECDLADGWALLGWRTGLCLLLPMVIVYKMLSSLWIASLLLGSLIGRLSSVLVRREKRLRRRWMASVSTSRMSSYPMDHSETVDDRERLDGERLDAKPNRLWLSPRWIGIGANGLRLLHQPLAIGLHLLIQWTAFRRQRRYLGAWLAVRQIIDGGGHVDSRGLFWLSAKVASCTGVIGFGRYWNERPIFLTGHWLEQLVGDRWYSFHGWKSLWGRRQEMRIALGDATPNSNSEYLRVGATALILDLIENGDCSEIPVLKNPLQAMRRFGRDTDLFRTTQSVDGAHWDAVSIHRLYVDLLRRFLQRNWQVPAEAWQILHLWQTTLSDVELLSSYEVGDLWRATQIDWLNKRWLLEKVSQPSVLSLSRKIDARYHELNTAGYYYRLMNASEQPNLVLKRRVERAKRNPPSNSPATQRGYLIREFADGLNVVRADWEQVEIRVDYVVRRVKTRR